MQLKSPFQIILICVSLLFKSYTFVPDSAHLVIQPDKQNAWDLKKDANDIQIYTRDYPDSPVKEFLAITICNSSLPDVVTLINNIEGYPKWLRSCKLVEPVKNESNLAQTNYVEISFPWPLSNRDGIWESTTITNTESTYFAEIRSRPELVPEKKGIVRMNNACGYWKIEKLINGQTKITQQFFADPEGNIPGWVVNLFLVDGPYDTFMNLLELLGEKR
jgi:hypothetical protein